MIALGILTSWLAMTAAGFVGLSALRRASVREDAEVGLAPSAHQISTFAEMRIPTSKALL
jgi:hypothetical protein